MHLLMPLETIVWLVRCGMHGCGGSFCIVEGRALLFCSLWLLSCLSSQADMHFVLRIRCKLGESTTSGAAARTRYEVQQELSYMLNVATLGLGAYILTLPLIIRAHCRCLQPQPGHTYSSMRLEIRQNDSRIDNEFQQPDVKRQQLKDDGDSFLLNICHDSAVPIIPSNDLPRISESRSWYWCN